MSKHCFSLIEWCSTCRWRSHRAEQTSSLTEMDPFDRPSKRWKADENSSMDSISTMSHSINRWTETKSTAISRSSPSSSFNRSRRVNTMSILPRLANPSLGNILLLLVHCPRSVSNRRFQMSSKRHSIPIDLRRFHRTMERRKCSMIDEIRFFQLRRIKVHPMNTVKRHRRAKIRRTRIRTIETTREHRHWNNTKITRRRIEMEDETSLHPCSPSVKYFDRAWKKPKQKYSFRTAMITESRWWKDDDHFPHPHDGGRTSSMLMLTTSHKQSRLTTSNMQRLAAVNTTDPLNIFVSSIPSTSTSQRAKHERSNSRRILPPLLFFGTEAILRYFPSVYWTMKNMLRFSNKRKCVSMNDSVHHRQEIAQFGYSLWIVWSDHRRSKNNISPHFEIGNRVISMYK